MNNFVKKKITE